MGKMQLNVPLVGKSYSLNNAIALLYPLEKNALSSVKTGLERAKTSMI